MPFLRRALTITSVSAPDAGGVVTYGYSYTLSAALTHTGQGEINAILDTITMSVTDATGDTDTSPANIVISIVDDVPVAANDAGPSPGAIHTPYAASEVFLPFARAYSV